MSKKNKKIKLLLVSASGGHLKQLLMLRPLLDRYKGVIVTERTDIGSTADYFMIQTGRKHRPVLLRMCINFIIALIIFIKEKPTHIISTGGIISVPFALLARITKQKIVFIETFARIHDTTRTG